MEILLFQHFISFYASGNPVVRDRYAFLCIYQNKMVNQTPIVQRSQEWSYRYPAEAGWRL